MKLSAAQRRVLGNMIKYDTTIMTINGRGGTHAFFRRMFGKPNEPKVRWRTLSALQDKGLIRNIEDPAWRWRGSEYEITEAGRVLFDKNEKSGTIEAS